MDRTHCPTDYYGNPQSYFSPVAPPEYCRVHEIPEPSSLALVALGLALAFLLRRKA